MKLMTPGKDGQLVLDFDDVVQRSMTVVRNGELTWPPPPVQVSAAPPTPTRDPAPEKESGVRKPVSARRRYAIAGTGAAALFLAGALAPPGLLAHLTVFALAIVIGYYVIGHVHHALHTPLMSVTNAISGIIVVGALLQIGHGGATHGDVITCAGLPRDPAGQHQRLRRFRRHSSDARHVLPKLTPCARIAGVDQMTIETAAQAAYSSRPCCSSWPWQGCPITRRPRPATPSASAAWRSRWQPRSPWRSTGTSRATGLALMMRRHGWSAPRSACGGAGWSR